MSNNERALIGDDAEAAIRDEQRAQADLTAAMVALVWRDSTGDPESAYERYFRGIANYRGIDLLAELERAAESGFLEDIDRVGEEVRREPTVLLSSAEMVRRARVAGMREVADALDATSAGAPRLMASSRIVEYIRARADRVEAEGGQDDPCPGWPEHSRHDHDPGGPWEGVPLKHGKTVSAEGTVLP